MTGLDSAASRINRRARATSVRDRNIDQVFQFCDRATHRPEYDTRQELATRITILFGKRFILQYPCVNDGCENTRHV